MKQILFWITTIIIVSSVNMSIVKKENTIAHGTPMLLKLAPVDPRSLIQGDYMQLRYAMARDIPSSSLESKGCIVVNLDENHVARFIRIYHGEPLQDNEHLLFYRNRDGLRLGAESFMFQEGKADVFSKAEYGELKVDKKGESVLVGLQDGLYKTLKAD